MKIDILLEKLAKPAQRAIQNENIQTLEELSSYTENKFKNLHGIGKNALSITKQVLSEYGLYFSDEDL